MILAIDLGSTEFKCGIFDYDGDCRARGAYKLSYLYPEKGAVELSEEEVKRAFITAILRTFENMKGETRIPYTNSTKDIPSPEEIGRTIKTICITSQAQTLAVADKNGQLKTNFISWLDERGNAVCEKLKKNSELSEFKYHSSIYDLLPGLQICHLTRLKKLNFINESDNIINLPSYIYRAFTGKNCIDNNLAAMSGMFSLEHNTWWDKALNVVGLKEDALPELTQIGEVKYTTADTDVVRKLKLKTDIPVVLCGNDQTAGAYGAEIHNATGALLTLGTAFVLYLSVDKMPSPEKDIIRGHYPNGKYYKLGVCKYGGNILSWAVSVLSEGNFEKFFSNGKMSVEGANGLVFHPEITMDNGTWKNISIKHTNSDFCQSVIDALVSNIVELTDKVLSTKKNVYREILAAGGGANSNYFLSLISEKTGMKIRRVETSPLKGAVLMILDKR